MKTIIITVLYIEVFLFLVFLKIKYEFDDITTGLILGAVGGCYYAYKDYKRRKDDSITKEG